MPPTVIPSIPDVANRNPVKVPAWGTPMLLVAAPAGIAALTPASTVISAGHTATFVASEDVNAMAQANHATAVDKGVVLFTMGTATEPSRPVNETGLRMHAATGNVNTQSQSAATKLTADQRVSVSSTHGMVLVAAPEHVLLTAAGAGIEINSEGITITAPGKVEFKASMKELTGPASAGASLSLQSGDLKGCAMKLAAATAAGAAFVQR